MNCYLCPRNGPNLTGGEAGIRTLETGFGPFNGLANRRLQPLGHLTLRFFDSAQNRPDLRGGGDSLDFMGSLRTSRDENCKYTTRHDLPSGCSAPASSISLTNHHSDSYRVLRLDAQPGEEAHAPKFQYIVDPPQDVPHLISQVETTCSPRGWGGAGLFLRFYDGQDYYNLGFAESITRLQFGVTLQQERFLSFRIKPQ
jgi:hypothetical protein